jgi:hypothetical protein
VRFHSSLDTFEDGLFLIEMVKRSRRVYFAERASYYKKQNQNCLTAQINYSNVVRQFMSVNFIVDVLVGDGAKRQDGGGGCECTYEVCHTNIPIGAGAWA